jgi:hypothetical protein
VGLKAVAKHEVSTPWNGDWRTLTDEQLDNMLESYRQMHRLSLEDMETMRLQVLGLDPGAAVHEIRNNTPALDGSTTHAVPKPLDAPQTPIDPDDLLFPDDD